MQEKEIKLPEESIELKSEEVREILSKPPQALVRWGSSLICGIILVFFIGSFFFYYPDTVETEIVITTENPPIWIVARSTGELKEISKQDKAVVKEGELIAVIENPANTSDVLRLKEVMKENLFTADTLIHIVFPEKMTLGMVQTSYSALQKAMSDYKNFVALDLYKQKIDAVNKQLEGYNNYIIHLKKQVSLNKKNEKITAKNYEREKKLFTKGLSSEAVLEEADKNLLSVFQGTEQLMTNVSSAEIEISKLRSSLTELFLQEIQEKEQVKTNLQSAYNAVQVEIKNWEQTYLLRSPSQGILSYNDIWKEYQNVNAGDKVFSVVWNQPGEIIGKVKINAAGSSGKVKTGQWVNIRVNGYPHLEYGYLTGTVKSISLLPDENSYVAIIAMPQELKTSYNKNLNFTGELSGIAEIITEKLSIGQRILSPVRYVFKKNLTP